MGVFERALRMAELPVRMSQGFNPRPRFSLPMPLAVGIEGLDEVLEIDLTEPLRPDEVSRRLGRKLPDGLDLHRAEQLEPGRKARVTGVTYHVSGELPANAIEQCLARTEIRATRRDNREIDIRPYLRAMTLSDGGCEAEVLVTEKGTARPTEILAALCGADADRARDLSLVRTAVNLATP